MVVIEMNPRVSRSSALASKATGFPIAKVAAKLAVGYTLDELRNDITGGATPASFEPTIDYVVTKVPRFAFEKFPQADQHLTTQMKSVGEVMAMGRTFQESVQKALRGLETGADGFDERTTDRDLIERELVHPGPDRLWFVADAFRVGMTLDQVHGLTHIDPWFLAQIEDIVRQEQALTGRLAGRARRRRAAQAQAQRLFRPAPGQAARGRPATGARAALEPRRAPGVQARGHLRGRVRHAHRLHVLHLRGGVRSPSDRRARRSWCWAAGPTASARASSSTTAACTRRSACARTGSRPSWSTATRRPCPPTTTLRTACTSSR